MPKLVANNLSLNDFHRLKLQASLKNADPEATPVDTLAQCSIADEWRSSFFSRLTFSWLFPLIKLGKTRTLTEDDIGENMSRDCVKTYLAKFEENLRHGKPETIASTIWKTFSHHEWSAVICKFTSDLMSYVPPLCISFIVDYAGDKDKWDDTHIFLAAAAMLVAPFITGLCNHWFYQFVMIDGLHARTTIQAAVYSKVLRISNAARTRTTKDGGVADMITNLQSTDCRSIEMVYWMWMYVWAAPLQVVITTVLLYLQLGWVVLVGIGVLVLLIPIQNCMMKSLKKLTAAASSASDQRIKLITETVHGIQVVKLQAWETMFADRVEKARALELKTRRRIAFLQGVNTAITESTAVLSTVVTFVTYGLVSDSPLTPAKAFTTLALFNILRTPITVLPMLIGMVAGGLVSVKRLAKFLYSKDAKPYVRTNVRSPGDPGFAAVVVNSASFVWEEGKPQATGTTSGEAKPVGKPFMLSIRNLALTPGSLSVIAGNVGAGKSSFLAALNGEMVLVENGAAANVELNGSVAFCSQEPWIQSATLRDNIIFGCPFDEQRYRTVLQACALEEDIAALPGGDQTEIGERGINLSGGQKARVSLGRACYADADIVILDDILSAVDAHVARTITDKCLVALLRNRGKTVLLATHQTLCFPEADQLMMLKDGQIAFAGTFAAAQLSPEFSDMLGKASEEKTATKAVHEEESSADGAGAAAAPSAKATVVKTDDAIKKEEGQLIKKEDAAKGAVTSGVYLAYIKMVGNALFVVVVLLAMMLNAQQILVNWWLSRWSVASEDPENTNSVHYYLWIYFALGMGACGLILSYQLVSAYGGLRAAARIHAHMFHALLGAPLSFFDTTPSGRLLNLFTADIKAIDETLIAQLNGSLSLIFMMLAVVGTVVAVVPVVVVPLVPLFWFYGWVQWIYRNTARELKRFDSTTQSPVFNHFAESLNGVSTIRAYRCEPRMLQETQRRVDANSRFWTKNNFVNRWLGLRLDWIGASLVGCTALACVLAIRFDLAALDPGLVGLVLSYTATLTGLLNWGVRRFSEAELGMVAVERTRQLFSCPQEEPAESSPTRLTHALLPANWPAQGEVRLTNVTARYRPGLPPVLRDVSVHIPKHAKVGVCGRTGSGKTTLAKCLFRLMEVEGGTIEIDGVDIARVRLADLRSKITMIPQDPTLFAGPLRYSLDPSGLHPDAKLWEVLSAVDLAGHVKGHLSNGLDAHVAEGGENWSAGQRQLLCLARALLEQTKLLVMDEATSNIDPQTDDHIQAMLQGAFNECAVLTIAHRIDTIMWYDKVLVLDQGSVLEYDSPKVLAHQAGSAFGALLAEYRKGKRSDL